VFPRRHIRRCPAIMLALSRTLKVIGRMMFLTSSIHTMKAIKATGVPIGRVWANIWIVFLIHPNIMKAVHVMIAAGNVSIICAVVVNTNGNRAMKLLAAMNINILVKIRVFPVIDVVPLLVDLISPLKVFTTRDT
jgi:hypothetical protein